MYEKEVGKKLKEARSTLKLSLNDVYKATGITDSRLSRMERGKTQNITESVKDINRLCELYKSKGVEFEWYKAKEILDSNIFSFLSEKDQRILATLASFFYLKETEEKKIFRLGELFSGPGGIAWGALNAQICDQSYKIEHAWANDIDPTTCNTYRRNISPDSPDSVICKDVRKLDIESLSDIDALAFGFPCNDYSLIGEKKGINGKYGPLFSYGIKALDYFKPQWFLAENVGGLKSANDGKTFKVILNKMIDSGYDIYPHLYKFEEYGIPQTRHRIIIVGIRNDLGYTFRVPSTKPYKHIDVSCRNAIENPPIPENASNNERTKQSNTVIKRLDHIKPGQNAYNADLPEELKLHVKGAKLSQTYKRLDPEKPAYTITGSGGGGTHVYHWKESRALTNRERARLQTFPDDFIFEGSKEDVRKQIGMAVPCKGAKIIFEAILNTFAGISYESVDCNISYEKGFTMLEQFE